jgi:hypothetical protein
MGAALNIDWGAPYDLSPQGVLTTTDSTLSTLNTKIGMVFQFDSDGSSDTITHVGFRLGTVTGTPGANSYRVGIQGVNSSGEPDGTFLGGGSPASATFTPSSGNANTWQWVALTNSISINRGALTALVLERATATDAANCIAAAYGHTRAFARAGIPYGLTNNASAWAKQPGNGSNAEPAMGCKSASAVYGKPAKNQFIYSDTYGATVEAGMYFTIPTNFASTFKVKGVEFIGLTPPSGTGVHYATLYENPVTGTIAIPTGGQSNATDNDAVAQAESTDRFMKFLFTGTLPTLSAGTEYGIGLAVTGSAHMALACLELQSAADGDAWQWGQQTGFMTRTLNTDFPPSSNDTNNFTKTATKRPLMRLLLADVTAPSGGGSTVYVGGVTF